MSTSPSLNDRFPQIANWVRHGGWVEIGLDGRNQFGVRILDEGGMIWEGGDADQSLDDLIQEAEDSLVAWLRES